MEQLHTTNGSWVEQGATSLHNLRLRSPCHLVFNLLLRSTMDTGGGAHLHFQWSRSSCFCSFINVTIAKLLVCIPERCWVSFFYKGIHMLDARNTQPSFHVLWYVQKELGYQIRNRHWRYPIELRFMLLRDDGGCLSVFVKLVFKETTHLSSKDQSPNQANLYNSGGERILSYYTQVHDVFSSSSHELTSVFWPHCRTCLGCQPLPTPWDSKTKSKKAAGPWVGMTKWCLCMRQSRFPTLLPKHILLVNTHSSWQWRGGGCLAIKATKTLLLTLWSVSLLGDVVRYSHSLMMPTGTYIMLDGPKLQIRITRFPLSHIAIGL